MKQSNLTRSLIHDLELRYHPSLGVHRTYRGFRYQPGFPIMFLFPNRNSVPNFYNGTLEEFQAYVDGWIINRRPGSKAKKA